MIGELGWSREILVLWDKRVKRRIARSVYPSPGWGLSPEPAPILAIYLGQELRPSENSAKEKPCRIRRFSWPGEHSIAGDSTTRTNKFVRGTQAQQTTCLPLAGEQQAVVRGTEHKTNCLTTPDKLVRGTQDGLKSRLSGLSRMERPNSMKSWGRK
jgi:hypothetical protein